jgi:hypothetical protein
VWPLEFSEFFMEMELEGEHRDISALELFFAVPGGEKSRSPPMTWAIKEASNWRKVVFTLKIGLSCSWEEGERCE